MRKTMTVYVPQYANDRLVGYGTRRYNVDTSSSAYQKLLGYWIPDPIKYDHCGRCGGHVDDHTFDGIGHVCVAPAAPAVPAAYPPWGPTRFPPPAKLDIAERRCRKCKNRSLREIERPDIVGKIAFCRLCGTEEEL